MSNERENTDAMKEAGKAAAQWVKGFIDRASRSPTPVEAWFSALGWQAARQSAGATGQEAIYQVSMQPNGPWQDISKATYDILVESDACPDVRIVYAALIGDNGAAHVRMATRTASGPELHAALAESQPSESKRVELTPTDIRAIANSYDLDNAPLIVEFSRALLARVSAKGE